MVDFNSPEVFSVDREKIVGLITLERYQYCLDAIEKYKQLHYRGREPPNYIVKSSIYALFIQVRNNLNTFDEDRFNKVEALISKTDFDSFMEAFELMSEWLMTIGILSFVNVKTEQKNTFDEVL